MDWKSFLLVFGSIFLAELGDKTQLVVLSFSATQKSKLSVFIGAVVALILTSLIAVVIGAVISHHITETKYVHRAAGVLFIVVGVLMVTGKFV
ncbi:TMEM165/GDT1 family protein [bacterium]|nr:TMEM165/GDT1 family protein [bacterium]RQV94569.1 MAG: TMEM165/GDT1 family protein [bacterium]